MSNSIYVEDLGRRVGLTVSIDYTKHYSRICAASARISLFANNSELFFSYTVQDINMQQCGMDKFWDSSFLRRICQWMVYFKVLLNTSKD